MVDGDGRPGFDPGSTLKLFRPAGVRVPLGHRAGDRSLQGLLGGSITTLHHAGAQGAEPVHLAGGNTENLGGRCDPTPGMSELVDLGQILPGPPGSGVELGPVAEQCSVLGVAVGAAQTAVDLPAAGFDDLVDQADGLGELLGG